TEINGDELTMTGIVASIDGTKRIKDTVSGSLSEPEKLGSELAQRLREQGAQEILDEIFATLERS
ncbi:MAG: hydroxymethylbilane synthase, partial [Cyanobacteria bacterium J06632_19]